MNRASGTYEIIPEDLIYIMEDKNKRKEHKTDKIFEKMDEHFLSLMEYTKCRESQIQ